MGGEGESAQGIVRVEGGGGDLGIDVGSTAAQELHYVVVALCLCLCVFVCDREKERGREREREGERGGGEGGGGREGGREGGGGKEWEGE